MERRLSEEGRYDEFKAAFEEEYGEPWEASRQDFDFIQDSVVDALVSMDFMSEVAARNWCEKAGEPYAISIEDFAKRVKTYIERKGNNHHVVFLVDEIGQYIGDDSKLMLNLQTVTEELGKECMGKAWVIVTSQQDIDSITKVKGNRATVEFDRKSACDSCHMCAVTRDGMKVKIVIDNTLGACVGDVVDVAMGERFVLTAAVIVYIIPLVLVGAGIGIGSLLGEVAQLLFALGGLVVGFGIAIALDRCVIRKRKGFAPRMTAICGISPVVTVGNAAGAETDGDGKASGADGAESATQCDEADAK